MCSYNVTDTKYEDSQKLNNSKLCHVYYNIICNKILTLHLHHYIILQKHKERAPDCLFNCFTRLHSTVMSSNEHCLHSSNLHYACYLNTGNPR